jgi:hypothetical protein
MRTTQSISVYSLEVNAPSGWFRFVLDDVIKTSLYRVRDCELNLSGSVSDSWEQNNEPEIYDDGTDDKLNSSNYLLIKDAILWFGVPILHLFVVKTSLLQILAFLKQTHLKTLDATRYEFVTFDC